VLQLTTTLLGAYGFRDYDIFLSTRPEHYVGTPEHWEAATNALAAALTTHGLKYAVDPGEGVFYGPKIDIKVKDHFGRSWQCATIQVDFNLPERFALEFRGEDSKNHRPVMIHRALMGSLERFFGILIEHYGGAFPLWLAPVQALVIPIAAAHHPYAETVAARLRARGIRVEIDGRNEKMGLKIRDGQLHKVPYMVIVGNKEQEQQTVSLRTRGGEQTADLPIDDLRIATKPRVNREIRSEKIRVISSKGEQLGVLSVPDALRQAEAEGLDLVEIAPTAAPPVCRIMDYGKYKYEQTKKQHAAKLHQRGTQLKEVKFRPFTSQHDVDYKLRHATDFLSGGHKVKLTVMFRGREMAHQEAGQALITRLLAALAEICTPDHSARMEGRNMMVIVSPKARTAPVKKKPAKPAAPKPSASTVAAEKAPASTADTTKD